MTAIPSNVSVTALVVTYQSAHTVAAALQPLREGYDQGLLRCVVVDNASSDDTPKLLQREAGWAKVLLEQVNHGFGRGCNVGLAHVQTPYTLLVNPDAIIGPEAIRTMVAFLDANPKVGIVGPATTVGEQVGEHYQSTGPRPGPMSILRRLTRLFGRADVDTRIVPGSDPFRTGWVCGALLMIRTDLMRQLGGFDPTYFLYWEEMDLCQRADAAGHEVWAVGTAVAHHVCGASTTDDTTRIDGCIANHYYRSRYHYLVKHHGWFVASLTEAVEFSVLGLLVGLDLLRGRGVDRIRPRLQARLFTRP